MLLQWMHYHQKMKQEKGTIELANHLSRVKETLPLTLNECLVVEQLFCIVQVLPTACCLLLVAAYSCLLLLAACCLLICCYLLLLLCCLLLVAATCCYLLAACCYLLLLLAACCYLLLLLAVGMHSHAVLKLPDFVD